MQGGTPVNESMVQHALLSLLQSKGVEPTAGNGVSVRVVARAFVILAGAPDAIAALALALDKITGAEGFRTGVWVLSESQARRLCDEHLGLAGS